MKHETIHQRLKRLRGECGLTVAEVSLRTGIPASTYKEWETGRQIRGEPYLKLASTFQVSLQELFTGEKPQQTRLLGQVDELQQRLLNLRQDLLSYF